VTPASATTIARLVKVLGMLGSPHVGERAAAGLKAHELIRQLGLRWDDVITLKSAVAGENDDNWKKMARHCARADLSIKERNFITNVLRWRSALSPKQRQWLEDIYERVTREAAA
jgi:NAD-specific glutamate dehydrogenase